jgi:dTDP-glucose 4,6-dehydratase
VLTAFINQIVNGEDLTLFGDGTQTRCFCYIDDMIDGLVKLFNSDEYEPTNFGNQFEVTINEFAERLLKISGANNKIIYKPLPQDDPKQRRADITKAKTLFGWEPKTELDEGLKKSFEYFRRK